jgi:hypothetical protein
VRTYEHIQSERPLTVDVLSARVVDGVVEWLRSSSFEQVPVGEGWQYPVELGDLNTIYQGSLPEGQTKPELRNWVNQECYRLLKRHPTLSQNPLANLWRTLRRYLPCQNSHGTVPNNRKLFEYTRHTNSPTRREVTPRSGKSQVQSSKSDAARSFRLLYKPNVIEAMDRKFLSFQRLQRKVMEIMVNQSRLSDEFLWTREELAGFLRQDKSIAELSDRDPWDIFVSYRSTYIRSGFIQALTADGRLDASTHTQRNRK